MSDTALDVTDATFSEAVLERSKHLPVIVDLWAPWCAPCRALGPVLERVARDADGTIELVKINVDENPVTASQLGARSIPLVVAFKDGQPVSNFLGAQPEGVVRRFVEALVPSEVDRMVADALRAASLGQEGDAETILMAALTHEGRHEGARLALAQLLGDTGRTAEALEVLAKADPSPAVDRLRSALRVAVAGEVDLDTLRARADAGDAAAAITLANVLIGGGEVQAAFDILLQAVRAEPRGEAGPARRAMLDAFNVLGSDPLVRQYRGRLARALF
jgi:putative thioredoxin